MPIPQDHKAYLGLEFSPEVSMEGYSEEETTALKRYGTWLKALMLRQIQPFTNEQRQFVQMCYGEAHPSNTLGRIWKRYQLDLMFRIALTMEARIANHDFPYKWIVDRFRTLAEQRHRGALDWLQKESVSFAVPETTPFVDIAKIYPRSFPKLDVMDTFRVLPGSFESGSRR